MLLPIGTADVINRMKFRPVISPGTPGMWGKIRPSIVQIGPLGRAFMSPYRPNRFMSGFRL